jgi:monomeric sarcosine oxidase
MNTNSTYDVIVLGLGAMGSAAAYHLAKSGKRVLAIEQFELGHAFGSSFGESRIIRYAYDHPAYIELAKHVYPLWRDVEQDTGHQLVVTTGGLDWGRPDDPHFKDTRDSLDISGIAYDWLTPSEVRERLPQFTLRDDEMGLYQADAGFVRATLSVIAHGEGARRHGAQLLTATPVERVEVHPDSVTVQTPNGAYSAGALVISAGPWAGPLLATMGLTVPLQPTREILTFFRTDAPALFTPQRCPIFIYHGGAKIYYGIPDADGISGFKVAQHGRHEPTDPLTIDRTCEDEYVEQVRGFQQRYVPLGGGELVKAYVCMYTMTPDEHFIIDTHPAYKHVAIGAGFSGHGFKFSTLIGKMLGELATDGASPTNNPLFRIERFSQR